MLLGIFDIWVMCDLFELREMADIFLLRQETDLQNFASGQNLLINMDINSCSPNLLYNKYQMKPQTNQKMKEEIDTDNILTCPAKLQEFADSHRRQKKMEEFAMMDERKITSEFNILEKMRPHSYLLDHKHPRYYMEYLHSKVKVPELGEKFHVHANELTSILDDKKIAILGSAPNIRKENTWEAAYYKDVKLILMLCPLYDDYIGISTDQYWPNEGHQFVVGQGDHKITVKTNKIRNLKSEKSEEQQKLMSDETYDEKEIIMEGPLGTKVLKHLHWDGWRDLGTPTHQQITILNEILDTCCTYINQQQMIWIHCFSGVGRTGTFTSLLEIKRHFEHGKKQMSIFRILQNIRKYRNSAVEMHEQYQFLYKYSRMLQQNASK